MLVNILWDFDGTIMNTYPAYTKIFKEVVGESVSDQEIYQQLKISFSDAFAFFELNNEQEKNVRLKARAIKAEELMPFVGVEEVLMRANLNVIMTHKEREDVNRILSYHGLTQYFIDMVAGDDGYPRKPDPASYQYLHDKYRIDLAVGDRELDIIPAKRLGMKTCLFQNNTAGADFYINDYRDFTEIFNSME